jgi:hypothetical protein
VKASSGGCSTTYAVSVGRFINAEHHGCDSAIFSSGRLRELASARTVADWNGDARRNVVPQVRDVFRSTPGFILLVTASAWGRSRSDCPLFCRDPLHSRATEPASGSRFQDAGGFDDAVIACVCISGTVADVGRDLHDASATLADERMLRADPVFAGL